jgi:hypothetical protein
MADRTKAALAVEPEPVDRRGGAMPHPSVGMCPAASFEALGA